MDGADVFWGGCEMDEFLRPFVPLCSVDLLFFWGVVLVMIQQNDTTCSSS